MVDQAQQLEAGVVQGVAKQHTAEDSYVAACKVTRAKTSHLLYGGAFDRAHVHHWYWQATSRWRSWLPSRFRSVGQLSNR